MAYLIHHHGTYWFQIRVPTPLTARHGQLVRQIFRRLIEL